MIVLKKKIHLTVICCLVLSFLPHKNFSQERKISEDELKSNEKIIQDMNDENIIQKVLKKS